LPANVSIVSGSTTIDGVSWGGDVVGAGLIFSDLQQGQTKTIKFRAKIDSAEKFAAGSSTLINSAYVTANNVSQLSDQASIIIYRSGQVLGTAGYVKTGANTMSLVFLAMLSCLIAFLFYCRLREDRLAEILNSNKGNSFYRWLIKAYFKLRFIFTIKLIRFKKVYW